MLVLGNFNVCRLFKKMLQEGTVFSEDDFVAAFGPSTGTLKLSGIHMHDSRLRQRRGSPGWFVIM